MRLLLLPLMIALLALASCSGKRLPENCYLQPESGKCRASILRWYRDDRTGACKAFVWGGCEGVVPFETQESCAAQCMAGQTMLEPLVPTGKNPPVTITTPAPASEPAARELPVPPAPVPVSPTPAAAP